MLCAPTVRRLEPGTFVQFGETFMSGAPAQGSPEDRVRPSAPRDAERPGFDGWVEALRRDAAKTGDAGRQGAIAPFAGEVGTDGLYDIVEHMGPVSAAASHP